MRTLPILRSPQPDDYRTDHDENQAKRRKPPFKAVLVEVKGDAILIVCDHWEIVAKCYYATVVASRQLHSLTLVVSVIDSMTMSAP